MEKQTGASTDKTAGVEKTSGSAPVSTNQTRNLRCKAFPVKKALKVRSQKNALYTKKKRKKKEKKKKKTL